MHLYVLVRGVKKYVRRWEEDLESVFFPFEFEKGKPGFVQLGVRPLQIYEIVFPRGQEERVMKIIGASEPKKYKALQKFVKVFAKLLGLKTVKPPKKVVPQAYVSVYPIGLKEDEFKNGVEQL
ncbi:MAG: hypothetical protein QXO15_10390 [Nitrososphaerota archaeon]